MASAIGKLIRVDTSALDRSFGSYVRILVEVDLATDLEEKVLLDTPIGDVWIEVFYDDIPPFCANCSCIGHNTSDCKRKTPWPSAASGDSGISRKQPAVSPANLGVDGLPRLPRHTGEQSAIPLTRQQLLTAQPSPMTETLPARTDSTQLAKFNTSQPFQFIPKIGRAHV